MPPNADPEDATADDIPLELLEEQELPPLPPLPDRSSADMRYFGSLLEWQTRVFVRELRRHETNDNRRHNYEMRVLGGIRGQLNAIDTDRDEELAERKEDRADRRALRDKVLRGATTGAQSLWGTFKAPIANAFTILVVAAASYAAFKYFNVPTTPTPVPVTSSASPSPSMSPTNVVGATVE